METVPIKIVGISATATKGGNCDKVMEDALKTAASFDDVTTELITLADKEYIKEGWRYRIVSQSNDDDPLVTVGLFLGYNALGSDSALVIELDASHLEDAGTIRIIPAGMILAMEVLERGEGEAAKEERAVYFG